MTGRFTEQNMQNCLWLCWINVALRLLYITRLQVSCEGKRRVVGEEGSISLFIESAQQCVSEMSTVYKKYLCVRNVSAHIPVASNTICVQIVPRAPTVHTNFNRLSIFTVSSNRCKNPLVLLYQGLGLERAFSSFVHLIPVFLSAHLWASTTLYH